MNKLLVKRQKIKHMAITKAICYKDFSGNSSILPRIKFRVGGQESSPQSLTTHSLDRYLQFVPILK